MKRTAIATVLCLGLGAIAALTLLLSLSSASPVAQAQGPDAYDTYYVAPGGACGTGVVPCYASVQAAVDAADDSADVVKVAAGTYTGVQGRYAPAGYYGPGVVNQVVYIAKTVTVQGGYTTSEWTTSDPEANPTTLDAQGQGRVLFITGDTGPTVSGLRLTNGNAAGLGGYRSGAPDAEDEDAGGGIFVTTARATIHGNQIFSNTAWHGGGLYTDSDAAIVGNTIISNTVDERGGGLWAGYGDVTISGNTIGANVAGYQGGGLFLGPVGHTATVSGNTIISNTAQYYGGGICLWMVGSDVTFSGNTILSNTAANEGGGVYLYGDDAILSNNVVASNQASRGSGLYLGGAPLLLHNTIARNVGGSGIYVANARGTAVLTNTILVSHTVGIDVSAGTANTEATLWGSGAWANGTDWSGNVVTGSVNLWEDPVFVGPDNGDYHIGGASAARDAGVKAGVSTDVDGQLRPMGLGYDIGADEYPGVGLDVAKRASEVFVRPGQLLTYTILVTSAGTENATGVVLTDTLDAWQRPISAEASAGGCTVTEEGWGGTIVCTPGTVVTGTTVVVTLTAEISLPVPIGQAMVNTVVATSNETANGTQVTLYAQNCHVRINDDPATYTTVQAAVDAASPNDVIKIGGYCVGVNTQGGLRQQVYLDKSLTLRGGYTTTNWTVPDPDANPTTLDALGQGRVLYITGDITPVVEGLRITGGDADGLGGSPWVAEDAGGGVYIVDAAATIRDNEIFGNASAGVFLNYGSGTLSDNSIFSNSEHGVYLHTGAATLDGNTIVSNTTTESGGGVLLFFSDATLVGNTVRGNTAESSGGGIHIVQGIHTLSRNTISNNTANGTDWMSETDGGGGLYLEGVSSVALDGNSIYSNTAKGSGGGLYIHCDAAMLSSNVITGNVAQASGGGLDLGCSQVTLDGNTVSGNRTSGDGGGLLLRSDNATLDRNTMISNAAERGGGLFLSYSDATLTNDVLADNQANATGSGLYVDTSRLDVMHTTIARNTGGDGSGIYVTEFMDNSTVALTNTILVSHTVGIYVSSGSEVEMEATLWGSGEWANTTDWSSSGTIMTGTVNLWDDPAFVDPDNGDHHVGGTSAACDAGVDAGVTTDIDGEPRPMGPVPDIGADECPGPSLDVVKRANSRDVQAGSLLTYTIVVTSVGAEDATGVALTDTLGDWQRPIATVASVGSCIVNDDGWGGSVVCDLGTLVTGEAVVVTLTAQVSTVVQIGQAMVNAVLVTANETANSAQTTSWCTSEGTSSVPYLVKDIHPGAQGSRLGESWSVNGVLLFVADDGTHGMELWKSDGTATGTVMIKDVYPGADSSWPEQPEDSAIVNGTLFFRADDGSHGYELWKSDGTVTGTAMVKDIFPGTGGSEWMPMVVVNETLFFIADDGSHGEELWKSDGMVAGTVMVKDIFPGPFSSRPLYLDWNTATVNGTLFFNARDGSHGEELWKSDGTVTGTVLVEDIFPGADSSWPRSFHNVNGMLLFPADDGSHGEELWKSDGTATGTVMVKDINPGASDSSPGPLAVVNGALFFNAEDGSHGYELWKSDGTVTGTVMVKDIYPGTMGSYAWEYEIVNGALLFAAEDGSHGYELWKSDGTVTGTVMVKDIYPGATSSYIDHQTNVNGVFFFTANDGSHGYELWKSDGTVPGTTMVKDIYPGAVGGCGGELWNVSGTLFFDADDGSHGNELWKSDGTVPGTTMVKDIHRGTADSDPRYLAVVNSTLFFRAYDGSHGYELWALSVSGDSHIYTLEVTKHASADTIHAGEQLTYTIRVTNTGNVDLHATVTDVLPSHVTSSGPLVWTPTIAAPGGSWQQTVVVAVDLGYAGPLTNVVQVTTEEGATGTYTETTEAVVTPMLEVTKRASASSVQAGEQLTYTIFVTNTGNVDLHATVTDVLPSHVTSSSPLVWMPTIAALGGVWEQTVVVTVDPGYAGPLTNVVQVTTEEGATGTYTETTESVITPMLEVTKRASSDTVQAGEQLTYTIRITNTGNVDLHATVTDVLPSHVTSSSPLVWTPTIAAPGGVWEETVVVTVEAGYSGPLTNTVQVTTEEGAAGSASATCTSIGGYYVYLPIVMRGYPQP